jgi:hypothetical protein
MLQIQADGERWRLLESARRAVRVWRPAVGRASAVRLGREKSFDLLLCCK